MRTWSSFFIVLAGLFVAGVACATPATTGSTLAPAEGTVQLSPIVVQGFHLPVPIVLQAVKTGLKLPWTNDLNDTRIRCRLRTKLGTHIGKTLWCESNREHILRMDHLHTALMNGEAMAAGKSSPSAKSMATLSQVTVQATNRLFSGPHTVSPGALHALLEKLPPAGSSYTMRITDHGKPVAAYVVKDGQLVKVIRYDKNAEDNQSSEQED